MKYLKLNQSICKAVGKYYYQIDKSNVRKYHFIKEHGETGTEVITIELLQRYLHNDIFIDWNN
jgi:hypothetical protein